MQINLGMQVWVRIGTRRKLGTVMAFPEPNRRNKIVRVRYFTGDERCVRPDQLEATNG